VQLFSTAIVEAPDDDQIGRNTKCTSDVKNNLLKKQKKR
jgi:hypothetical protein